MCAKEVWTMGTHQTQVALNEEKAKVEAEAVHGAQRWKIHDGTP